MIKCLMGLVLYPRHLKMRACGKRVKALSIDGLCDLPERAAKTHAVSKVTAITRNDNHMFIGMGVPPIRRRP